MRTGSVLVKGPFTREEKARRDWLRERKKDFEDELVSLRQLLLNEPDCERREIVEEDIAHDEAILEKIRRVIPD